MPRERASVFFGGGVGRAGELQPLTGAHHAGTMIYALRGACRSLECSKVGGGLLKALPHQRWVPGWL